MINHRGKDRLVEARHTDSLCSAARKIHFPKRSSLSQETREKVLQVKKIADPFDAELQGAFSEFVQHVDNVEEEDVDLPEVSLLLSGATKIYTSQVDSLVKDIEDLLLHCTRTKKASSELKTKKNVEKEEEPKPETDGVVNADKNDEKVPLQMNPVVVLQPLDLGELSAQYRLNLNGVQLQPQDDKKVPEDEEKPIDIMEIIPSDSTDENTIEVKENPSEIQSPDAQGASSQINEENGEPVKKKRKNGINLPPELISCAEELEQLMAAGFFDDADTNHLLPPSLDKAFRVSKRKLYLDDVPSPLVKKMKEALSQEKAGEGSEQIDSDNILVKEGELDNPDIEPDIAVSFTQHFPSTTTTAFSPEDQADIQECINELHYMPFTFGLSKKDVASAFSKTVDKMSEIFKKNNVLVTKNMVKEASVIASTSETCVKKNGIIHPVAHNLGDIYNTFVKMCRDECETFLHNSSTSIMERAKEKSFAESRANIRSMIAELQRNIVPKFARVALMAENTPEFFQHVTNFEKRMKKILEEEAKKDEFDVRKYEREVLEVTAKESSELEHSEEFLVPNSPLRVQSIDGESYDQLFHSPSTRSSFDGSHCSGSNSWVPLKHIFHHLKSFDRTETARSFYAVLALLSYQNLDINYDQLYSVESAALIKKQHTGVSKDDEKFPRGVKIMTSRCPDADKEEVFVAALTAESRDEEFRHLLAKEARNLALRDGAPEANNCLDTKADEGIAEAMADFVEETSSVFKGQLHGRRRKKKDA